MNYFRGFKSVLGSPSAENQPSAQETVERLCDRVESSTLLEDRRDAVRALKSLSKKFKLEVGTKAMELLINVLQSDRNDTEIVGMSLETLCNVMSTDPQDEQPPTKNGATQSDSDVGLQFTEIFIKNSDNVTLLLGILEEYEFHVRWPTVKLLTMLLTNKPNLLQQCVLVSPMGVSRLMDLLSDSREIIRNEGLLLLIQLTKSNAAIQKIVAFENAFDRLFEIVAEEGHSDGGIVVEDCLRLMINLLRNNVSNQNFFREGSFIQRFTPFFEMSALAMQGESEDETWLEQKVSNVQLMLKVVRILVSPDNPQQATTGAQKMMNQSGLLKLLCDILMASGIPADILTEAINTVSEVIRGFPANQEYFSCVNAPSDPPRPAIVVLLMSMINDKQPFSLRCAVLYCFQCYLYKNEQGQSQIVSTLLPSSADVASSVSAGQLLCAGLFSMDPLSNWCAAVALSHCLKGNPTQKEQLLRVQLATSVGNAPVSLLQQCTNIFAQGGNIQTRVGLLMLLCSWLSNCPIAIAHFLHNAANVPYLMAQVGVDAHGEEGDRLVGYLCALLLGLCLAYNDDSVEKFKKDDLRLLMNKRIGLDNLLEKIGYISKSEFFTSAVKSPEIKDDGIQQVLIDHEFTKLFKRLDAAVTKAVEETSEPAPSTNHQNGSIENHDSIVASYKELIREQDEELCRLKSRFGDLDSSYNQANAQLQLQAQEITQLRSQLSFAQSYQNSQQLDGSSTLGSDSGLLALQQQMSDLQINKQELEKRLQEKEEKVQKLEKDLEVAHAQYAVAAAAAELADSYDANDPLSSSLNKNQLEDLLGLRRTVSSLEHELSMLREQNTSLQVELDRLKSCGQVPVQASLRIQELETELVQVTEEKDNQLQEHEDLLVMLADQEEKIAKYKKLLKEAGHEVSADEDEDFEEDEDEEEEGDSDDVENSAEVVEDSIKEDLHRGGPSNELLCDQHLQPTESNMEAILHDACQEQSTPQEESHSDDAGRSVEEPQEDIEASSEQGPSKHTEPPQEVHPYEHTVPPQEVHPYEHTVPPQEVQPYEHTVPPQEVHPYEHTEPSQEVQPQESIEPSSQKELSSQCPYLGKGEQETSNQRTAQEQNRMETEANTSPQEAQAGGDFYSQQQQGQVEFYSDPDQGQIYSNQDQSQMNPNQNASYFYPDGSQANINTDQAYQQQQQQQQHAAYNYYTMPSDGGQMNFFSANTQGQANYDNSFTPQSAYYPTDGSTYTQYHNQMNQYQANNTTAEGVIKQDAGLMLDVGDNSNNSFLT